MQLLGENKVVTITARNTGAQVKETPVLDGSIRLATGAPHFALNAAAPLLPVFCHRDGSQYVVEVAEPILLTGMKREDAFTFACAEFGRQMSAYVEKHPKDWAGWYGGVYSEPSSPSSN